MEDEVEILVQAVEEEGEKLLRVVLIGAAELRCEVADGFLGNVSRVTEPLDAP